MLHTIFLALLGTWVAETPPAQRHSEIPQIKLSRADLVWFALNR